MNVADSQRLSVFVTHVAPESTVLKIWAQLDSQVLDQIEACLNELEQYFEVGKGTPHPGELNPSDICCAKCSEDGKWYRAKIINLSQICTIGKLGVKFIDYGNQEVVHIQDVRKTDNKVCNFPPQATEFILNGVKPIGTQWESKTIDFLNDNIRYQTVTAFVIKTTTALKSIKILAQINGIIEDMSELLIKMKMAERNSTECNYSHQKIDSNREYKVYVSSITTIDDFYINLTDTANDLIQLNEDLNGFATENNLEKLQNFKQGIPCLARFSEDNSFYRAQVYTLMDSAIRILFVDYGNWDVKIPADIYVIPPNFVSKMPIQGLKCRLKDCNTIPQSQSINDLFKSRTTDTELKCKFLCKNPDESFNVELSDENDDLTRILKESRSKTSPPPNPTFKNQEFEVGNAYEVELTHVESINSFYLRHFILRNTYEKLEEQLYIEQNAKVYQLSENEIVGGLICAVRKNFVWYRSQVIEIVSFGMVKIQYVDIGDFDIVPTTRLKRLSSGYTRDPQVLAKECALYDCALNSPDLSFDLERLTAAGPPLLAKIIGEIDGKPLVDLFNIQLKPHIQINKEMHALSDYQRVIVPDPTLGPVETIYVINIDDNGIVYGQLTQLTEDQLSDFQDKLNKFYVEIGGVNDDIDLKDRFCCTQFSEDGLYYRGEILKEFQDDVEVYFIDYGNVEVKSKDLVKKLDPSFAKMTRQVVKMKLMAEDFLIDDEFKNLFIESTIEVEFFNVKEKLNYFKLTGNAMNAAINCKMMDLLLNQPKVERKLKFGTQQIPKYLYPDLVEREQVIVTHYESPNWFGCQLQKNANELRTLCGLVTKFANEGDANKRKINSPLIGQPCIANYYGEWFRAEVKQVFNSDEIEVTYVDFGNSEKIKLDSVQAVPPSFLVIPRQCLFCKLDGVEGDYMGRDNKVLDDLIKEKAFVATFNNLGVKKEPYSITLMDGYQNINQKFFKLTRPITSPKSFSSMESVGNSKNSWSPDSKSSFNRDRNSKNNWSPPENDPKPQNNSYDYNSSRKLNNSFEDKKRSYGNNNWNNSSIKSPPKDDFTPRYQSKENDWDDRKNFKFKRETSWDSNSTGQWNGASNESQKTPPIIDSWRNEKPEPKKQHSPFSNPETNFYNGNFKCISLTSGTTKEIVISFVNSISDFYIQLSENADQLESLSDSLMIEYNDESQRVVEPKPKTICCAKYSKDDNWYRAEVTKNTGNEIEVRFVDYGNNDLIRPELIKGLKREHGELPIQAIKCSLHNIVENVDVTDRFSDLVLEQNLNARIIAIGNNGNLIIDLFDVNGISIAQQLADEGLVKLEKIAATCYNNVELTMGSTCDVTLTWFVSPTWFYVNLKKESSALEKLMDEMQDFYTSIENDSFSVPELKEGMACVAQFTEDDVWYRAKIRGFTDDGKIQVEYVDFGNGEINEKKRIRGLEMKFAVLPIQGVKCRLRSIRPNGNKWDKIPRDKMEFYYGKISKCTFYAMHKDIFLVDIENEGQSVAQSIVNDGFAQFTSSYSTSVTSTGSDGDTINPYPPFQMDWNKDEYKDIIVCSLGKVDRFWCQLLNCNKPTLANRLNEYYSTLEISDQKLTNPKKGTACVIKSARDKNWYRAVVQNRPSPSKLSVLCVDTGMEEIIHISQAKIIITQFLEYPIAAFPCILQGVSSDVNPDDFIRATYTKELVAQIKDQFGDTFQVVLFELNEKEERNLNELLASTVNDHVPDIIVTPDTLNGGGGFECKRNICYLEKCLDPDCFDLLAPFAPVNLDWSIGEDKIVRISNLGSPESFWCQFESSDKLMDELQLKLNDYYSTQSARESCNWIPCKPCVIRCKVDNKWYRASVIRRRSLDEIEVLLIDVGLVDEVTLNEIHEISQEFLTIQPQAFHCQLSNIQDINEPSAANAQFLSFVGEHLTAKLNEINKNIYKVSLYDLTTGEAENILSRLTGKVANETSAEFVAAETDWEISEIKNVRVSGPGLPDQFWCQLTENIEKIDQLANEMADYYNSLPSDKMAVIVPSVGKAVAVQSRSNQKWHRAIVRSITKSSKVMVSLVDTGEWEKVGVNQLKAITQELMSKPILAIECRLSSIPDKADIRTMGYDFFDMTIDKELKAILNAKNENIYEITLIDGDITLNDKLISIYQGKLTEKPSQYKSAVIIPGTHEGYLSHITNPRSFYVQLTSIQDSLIQLNDQLNDIYSTMEPNESTLPLNSLPGQPCCAPFEHSWYRSELLTTEGNCSTVKFIDYGNIETISQDKVKQLDAELITSITPLAIECCLANSPTKYEWSEDEMENFLNMVLEKQLFIEFITTVEPCSVLIREEINSQPIKLSNWDDHVTQQIPRIVIGNEFLIEKGDSGFNYREFPANKRLLGGISHIVSPGQFWMQLDDDTNTLEKTVEMLEEVYVNKIDETVELSQSELCSGYACAAQYSQDGGWYRGKVLAVELNDVHVQFVDYGNSDTVKLTAVRRLTRELLELPVMAIECELDGVCQREDDWTVEAIEQFEELVSDKSLLVEFERRCGEKYFVRLMDMGVDLIEEMAKKGFATLQEGYVKKAISCVSEVDEESKEATTRSDVCEENGFGDVKEIVRCVKEGLEDEVEEPKMTFVLDENEIDEIVNVLANSGNEIDLDETESETEVDEGEKSVEFAGDNLLENIDIEEAEKLENIDIEEAEKLENIDTEENGKLEDIDVEGSEKSENIDVERSEKFENIDVEGSEKSENIEFEKLENIDVDGSEKLENIEIEESGKLELENIDDEGFGKFEKIDVEGSEKSENIDIEENGKLELEKSIEINDEKSLEEIDVEETEKLKLENIDIEETEKLKSENIDIEKSGKLENIDTEETKITQLKNIDETEKPQLESVDIKEIEKSELENIEETEKSIQPDPNPPKPTQESSTTKQYPNIVIESILEPDTEFFAISKSEEDLFEFSPEHSSEIQESSYITADDVVSSEQSTEFDTHSTMDEDECDTIIKMANETKFTSSDTDEKSIFVASDEYQASVSCNLDSSLDISHVLDASCTTISSSFEFAPVETEEKSHEEVIEREKNN